MAKTIDIQLPDFGKVVEEVTNEVRERVARRTPVDTGRAQEGWQSEVVNEKGRIWNDTPYVGYLEDGTYKMAPFHMVKTTLEEVPDIITAAMERHQKGVSK